MRITQILVTGLFCLSLNAKALESFSSYKDSMVKRDNKECGDITLNGESLHVTECSNPTNIGVSLFRQTIAVANSEKKEVQLFAITKENKLKKLGQIETQGKIESLKLSNGYLGLVSVEKNKKLLSLYKTNNLEKEKTFDVENPRSFDFLTNFNNMGNAVVGITNYSNVYLFTKNDGSWRKQTLDETNVEEISIDGPFIFLKTKNEIFVYRNQGSKTWSNMTSLWNKTQEISVQGSHSRMASFGNLLSVCNQESKECLILKRKGARFEKLKKIKAQNKFDSMNLSFNNLYLSKNGESYEKVEKLTSINEFPFGFDGDLVVKNKQTLTVNPLTQYDLESLTVKKGGKIELMDKNLSMLMLYVAGNAVIDGEIKAGGGQVPGSLSIRSMREDGTLNDSNDLNFTMAPPQPGGSGGQGGAAFLDKHIFNGQKPSLRP